MNKEYVGQKDGAYRIADTRVSLDSVVYAFHRGASPEGIQRSFPTLTLEQIYGAIAYYLAHQKEIDQYLVDGEAEFENLRRDSRASHPDWYEKLDHARREDLTPHS
jgi:uncharacterized protein (DUF433 family)